MKYGNALDLHLDDEHRYWSGTEELWGVSSVLKDNRLLDDQWFSEESRQRGTFVHAILAAAARGEHPYLPFVDEEYRGWCQSGLDFLDMLQAEGAAIEGVELRLYSQLYRFAGTIDLFVRWRGYPWIFDFKTGKTAKTTRFQLGAYGLLVPQEERMIKRAAVELQEDGGRARLVEYNMPEHFHDGNRFLGYLNTSRDRKQFGPKES